MTSLQTADMKYRLAAESDKLMIALMPVDDNLGSKFTTLLCQLLHEAEDNPDIFDELINATKAFCWRMITDIQPPKFNRRIADAKKAIDEQLSFLQYSVDNRTLSLFNNIRTLTSKITQRLSPSGLLLLQNIDDMGDSDFAVVVSNRTSKKDMTTWLRSCNKDVSIYCPGDLSSVEHELEQLYLIGPPRFFPPSVFYSPVSSQLGALVPSWYRNRQIPESAFQSCEGRAYQWRLVTQGKNNSSTHEYVQSDRNHETVDQILDTPVSVAPPNDDLSTGSGAIDAQYLVLAGGYYCYLDHGNRIEIYNPQFRRDSPLSTIRPDLVGQGIYLVLPTDRDMTGSLRDVALNSFGERQHEILETQSLWKHALKDLLAQNGPEAIMKKCRRQGIHAASQIDEWPNPDLDRPQKNSDFHLLLELLHITDKRVYDNATSLRSKRLQLGKEVRRTLERAITNLPPEKLKKLNDSGHLELSSASQHFRHLLIAEVIQKYPKDQSIPRQRVRIAFKAPARISQDIRFLDLQ